MMRLGIGVGVGRQRFAGGFADSYSSRVLADGGTIEALTCVANASTLLQQASLLFIPSGYKAGVAYSAFPNNGNGDLTWTRNSTANRTLDNGNIGSVGANVPRLSYMYGTCPSALLEPQRTNLDPTSQGFGGAWNLTNSGGVTISNVSATNPFGFSSVTKVIPTTTLGQHRPYLSANYSAVGRIWVIAKADGYNYLSFGEGGGINGGNIIFNLSNGTISGSAFGYTGEISPLGDGWYKCSLNMTTLNVNVSRWIIIRNNNTTADYSGDGTSGVLIAHKQMEVGAYDTTAIFTTGTTATRIADTFTRNNIYTNGVIGASGGTWYVELKNNVSYTRDNDLFWGIGDSLALTTNSLIFLPSSNGRQVIRKYVGGVLATLFTTTTTNVKIAIKWNGSTADIFVNGVKQVSATAFTATNLQFLTTVGIGTPQFIQTMALYNEPKSDQFCIDLTT